MVAKTYTWTGKVRVREPKKRKNPADSTLRNVRSANKRIKFLEHRIDTLCAALNDLREQIADVNKCMAINVESLNTRLIKFEQRRG